MVFPAKTNSSNIVDAAIDLINANGVSTLTVGRLAEQIGIKAPSLYKYFKSRDAILSAVETRLFDMLGHTLAEAMDSHGENVLVGCTAYRQFAKLNARAYPLLFTESPLDGSNAHRVRQQAAEVVLRLLERDSADLALAKAQTLTAYLHGFVMMELSGAFQLGGNVDRAFEIGTQSLATALTEDA